MLMSLVLDKQPIEQIGSYLDALSPEQRLLEVRELSAEAQAILFELAAGHGCTLDGDFVPEAGTLAPVIHEGRNSLPLFRLFQKRFARLAGEPARCTGYNEQTMRPFTGPGFFTAREDELDGVKTVVIDYKDLPSQAAEGWPSILPNTARLSRFVYNGTEDWMWRVSKHVTIGRARRASGWMNNWFVLCRTPAA